MSRKILGAWLAWLVFNLLPGPAGATFHLVKVVEVFAGTTAEPTAQYVMLQMYSPGQTLVTGHSMTVFDANGTTVGTFTFSHSLSNGRTLATILIATPDATTLFGVTADLTMTPVIPLGGGAVCWDVVNCVAWGSFSASGSLPISPGSPFNPPSGLLLDMVIHRDLSSGGAVTNFVFAPPAPKNNAGQSGTLSPTPTVPSTVTPTPTPGSCVGDCNGDGQVTVNELLIMVNIALGNADISTCTAGDTNQDGSITINEILAAVRSTLNGCAPGPSPTPTALCLGEIDCGGGRCCPNSTTCGNQRDCCPSGFPVDCGPSIGCCPDGSTCGALGNCCPSGFPVDCGPGNGCCPSGTVCGKAHCF